MAASAWRARYARLVAMLELGQKHFEKFGTVYTITGGLMSASAAWFAYAARQHHMDKLEKQLDGILEAQHHLEEHGKATKKEVHETVANHHANELAIVGATGLLVGFLLGRRSTKLLPLVDTSRWRAHSVRSRAR